MVGCSTTQTDPTEGLSAAELYALAKDNLDTGNYSTAIENYEKLESRYPFGDYATQAQLDVAYAYYLYDEPESATAAADRFIKLHPRHESVDYAYYLKGLVNFGLKDSIMDNFYTRDLADYDKNIMQQAYEDFSILVNRFPDSKYTPDAIKRMVFLRNQMAHSDLKIAKFYLGRKAWVAAANRAESLLQEYQGSSSIKGALQVLILAYEQLQLNDLAQDTRRILIHNYGEEAANITLEELVS
jgi:outer membrane protein assembly factor BamD